jgi:glycerol-3-phosphate acyltransferase PlsX
VTVVALDAFGGDFAPQATVDGAVRSAEAGMEVALVGDQTRLTVELERHKDVPSGLRIVHAPDAIGMGDTPSLDMRRRTGSSMFVGLDLIKRGEAEAFVSMGNTGAVLALSLIVLGKLPGVERPALAALIPSPTGEPTLVVDIGANAESRATHLVQWAALGTEYMRVVMGIEHPTVGLLNIGAEPSKGSPREIEVHEQLTASSLDFVGNVEGSDVLATDTTVIVTDGYTGNVALKLIEGSVSTILGGVRDATRDSLRARAGGLLMMPSLRALREAFDYRQYGGVPLIGVNGLVLVGHGRSDSIAVENAIRTAAEGAEHGAIEAMAAVVASGDVASEDSAT